ncbi:Phospholipase A-2-activating protein [Nymphaea thermarum]|nr:Phospholipase A-2-activating protein [Nymphaea thermarum]
MASGFDITSNVSQVRGVCVCGDTGIATASRDKTVKFWVHDSDHGYRLSKTLAEHTSFVGPLGWIAPCNDFPEGGIVSGGMDTMILLWDLKSAKTVHRMRGHQLQVTGLAIDGCDIVSSSIDCTIKRWRKGQVVASWEAHKAPVQAVIRLPSGELVTGSSDASLKLWRDKTCTGTFTGHTDTVRSLAAISDVGILSASHDGSIKLWSFAGEILLEMVGHTSLVYSVDSHVSGLIASGSEDCSAKIWKDGTCIQTIEHPGCVWDVKFLSNGDIITACSDGVARIWTTNGDRMSGALDIQAYAAQLSEYKCNRCGFSFFYPILLRTCLGLSLCSPRP